MNFSEIEWALAADAAAFAVSARELNPYAEAEVAELGNARLVYSGAASPVHGVFGLGLDGPVEDHDWKEIERFFARVDRAPFYWLTPSTDHSVLEGIRSTHRPTRKLALRGVPLSPRDGTPAASPDHTDWALTFSRLRSPHRTEPDLFALTKSQQRNTRYYLRDTQASYTFFHRGVALTAEGFFLPVQKEEAEFFRCSFLAGTFETSAAIDLPLLYERILYEPV